MKIVVDKDQLSSAINVVLGARETLHIAKRERDDAQAKLDVQEIKANNAMSDLWYIINSAEEVRGEEAENG